MPIELPLLLVVALLIGLVLLTVELFFLFKNKRIFSQISNSTHIWMLLLGLLSAFLWYDPRYYINTPFIPIIDLSIVSIVLICLAFTLFPHCWIFFIVNRQIILSPLKKYSGYAVRLIFIYACILISLYFTLPSLKICFFRRNLLYGDPISIGAIILVGSSIISIFISTVGILISNSAVKLELGSAVKHAAFLCSINKIIISVTVVFGLIAFMVGVF